MHLDREQVGYRISFIPERGHDPKHHILSDEVNGVTAAVKFVEEELQRQYGSTDWLEPDSGYGEFVEQNRRTLALFQCGFVTVAAFTVPYGVVVVC